jgi:hypothetical protein
VCKIRINEFWAYRTSLISVFDRTVNFSEILQCKLLAKICFFNTELTDGGLCDSTVSFCGDRS